MERSLLMCKNCRNLANGAHESSCCGFLYCEDCSQNGNLQCPSCHQENVIFKQNLFIARLIRNQDCLRTFLVNQPGFDPAIPLVNENGVTARMGASGKYYCGQPRECCHFYTRFQHPNCACVCCTKDEGSLKTQQTSGLCGPSSGCNCSACQKLDIAMRGLPNKWLVSPDGTLAKWHPDKINLHDGIFSCGRMYEEVVQVKGKSWLEKFSDSVKGHQDILIKYCGQMRNICPSCACMYDHVIFGNQYRSILGLPNIDISPATDFTKPSTSA